MGQLLERAEKQTGLAAVAIPKSSNVQAQFVPITKASNENFDVVAFETIKQTLQILKHDAIFRLGDVALYRREGWPMGGSFSEPATLVDLGAEVLKLYRSYRVQAAVGWVHDDVDVEQLLCGLCHVDDALLTSLILCSGCLLRGIQALYPSDVGVSLEEEGEVLKFLQAVVDCTDYQNPRIFPYMANVEFSLGLALHQNHCRIGKFLHPTITPFSAFKVFVTGQLLSHNHIFKYQGHIFLLHLFILLAEFFRLNYPDAWLCKAIKSVSVRHDSIYIRVAKRMARVIRMHGLETTLRSILDTENFPVKKLFGFASLRSTMHSRDWGWNSQPQQGHQGSWRQGGGSYAPYGKGYSKGKSYGGGNFGFRGQNPANGLLNELLKEKHEKEEAKKKEQTEQQISNVVSSMFQNMFGLGPAQPKAAAPQPAAQAPAPAAPIGGLAGLQALLHPLGLPAANTRDAAQTLQDAPAVDHFAGLKGAMKFLKREISDEDKKEMQKRIKDLETQKAEALAQVEKNKRRSLMDSEDGESSDEEAVPKKKRRALKRKEEKQEERVRKVLTSMLSDMPHLQAPEPKEVQAMAKVLAQQMQQGAGQQDTEKVPEPDDLAFLASLLPKREDASSPSKREQANTNAAEANKERGNLQAAKFAALRAAVVPDGCTPSTRMQKSIEDAFDMWQRGHMTTAEKMALISQLQKDMQDEEVLHTVLPPTKRKPNTAENANPDKTHRNEIEEACSMELTDGSESELAWLRRFKQIKADVIKAYMQQLGFTKIQSESKEAYVKKILKFKREQVYS